MDTFLRRLIITLISAILLSPALPVHADSDASHRRLTEDAALQRLTTTIERDRVYEGRISLDCVTFGTEEKTETYFAFVLREKHGGNCAGDPQVSPVLDRYRVNRDSGKIEKYDPVEDKWTSYATPRKT